MREQEDARHLGSDRGLAGSARGEEHDAVHGLFDTCFVYRRAYTLPTASAWLRMSLRRSCSGGSQPSRPAFELAPPYWPAVLRLARASDQLQGVDAYPVGAANAA
jgi:hypothetical protein